MPASSAGRSSAISTLNPLRSAHLIYILISICAQSWLSVPPAPGLTVNMALFLSSFNERVLLNSISSSSAMSSLTSLSASSRRDSPSSSSDSSRRILRFSNFFSTELKSSREFSVPDLSLRSAWAVEGLSHKFSSNSFFSIDWRCSIREGTSKIPPEGIDLRFNFL